MKLKYKIGVLTGLFSLIAVTMLSGLLASCGKESVASASGLNTQVNILNLSPDIYPLKFYVNNRQFSTKSYIYNSPSGYFYMTSLDTPVQIRTLTNTIIFDAHRVLSTNIKYSLFVTGLLADKTDTVLFLTDTASAPSLGRAKVRFVNASAKSAVADVYANGTLAFPKQGFLSVSKYIEMPAGIYDFKIYASGTSTVYTDLPNTTLQDGRLYTVYSKGIVNRADSASYGAGVVINR